MNTTIPQTKECLVAAPAGYTELVRGNEDRLVAILAPIAREVSVVLDLERVHRIDAAGIAALISIYGCARNTGHTFRIINVNPHVAEILKLVGLDHILVAREEVQVAGLRNCIECPAA